MKNLDRQRIDFDVASVAVGGVAVGGVAAGLAAASHCVGKPVVLGAWAARAAVGPLRKVKGTRDRIDSFFTATEQHGFCAFSGKNTP